MTIWIADFFLWNLADFRWTISDCTAKAESWATNAPNATLVLTHRWYKSRALQLRRMRNSTLEKCVIILTIYSVFFLWTNQRVAYVYKAKKEIQGSKIRVIWGWAFHCIPCRTIAHFFPINRRVTRPHGSSGVVKSKFRNNLPPRAFGASVRVVGLNQLLCTTFLDLVCRCSTPRRFKSYDFIPPRIVCCNMTCSLQKSWTLLRFCDTLILGSNYRAGHRDMKEFSDLQVRLFVKNHLACHFYLARRILFVLVVRGKQLDDSSPMLGQLPVSYIVDLECELNKHLGHAKYNWEVFRSHAAISGLTYRCPGPTELGISTYRRRDCDQVYYAIWLDQFPILIKGYYRDTAHVYCQASLMAQIIRS